VIREADLLARTSLQKIAVVQDLETNLALVYGDEGALANALMNLCVNAMDAMPDGGRLTIRTRNEPQGRVSLAVEDTGQGMTEAVRLRALEPFFTTKPLGKGTGLGLAMVFGTAQAHGGSLELQSELGNGTTVVLTVPSNLDAHSTGPDPQLALDPQSLPSCRILMVDDEALIRASVPPLLRALGHRVDVTASGLEALRIFAEDPAFDLVIIDLNMPGLDGESTLWRIRRVRPEIPVLVVSGHVDPLTQARLMAVPNLAFVNKPFRTMELQVAMARLLRSREG
jgi:CheY-like chemotaxis protein